MFNAFSSKYINASRRLNIAVNQAAFPSKYPFGYDVLRSGSGHDDISSPVPVIHLDEKAYSAS